MFLAVLYMHHAAFASFSCKQTEYFRAWPATERTTQYAPLCAQANSPAAHLLLDGSDTDTAFEQLALSIAAHSPDILPLPPVLILVNTCAAADVMLQRLLGEHGSTFEALPVEGELGSHPGKAALRVRPHLVQ